MTRLPTAGRIQSLPGLANFVTFVSYFSVLATVEKHDVSEALIKHVIEKCDASGVFNVMIENGKFVGDCVKGRFKDFQPDLKLE